MLHFIRNSITTKLSLLFISVSFSALLILTYYVSISSEKALLASANEHLDALIHLKIKHLQESLESIDRNSVPEFTYFDLFQKEIEQFDLRNGFSLIIKPPSTIVAATRKVDLTNFNPAFLSRSIDADKPYSIRLNIGGQTYIARYESFAQGKWILLAGESEGELLGELSRLQKQIWISLVGILFVVFLVSKYFAKSTATPIVRLAQSIWQFGKDMKVPDIESKRTDEIGTLTNAFLSMASNLKNTTLSKEQVEIILASMSDALFVLDNDGKITMINHAAGKMVDSKEERLKGQKFENIFSRNCNDIKSISSHQPIIHRRLNLRLKTDKKIPALISGSEMHDDSGKKIGTVITIKDITEIRALEKKAEEQRAMAVYSAKMATLGEMSGGIAHEINNPLAVLQGYCLKAKKDLEKNPDNVGQLDKALDNIFTSSVRIGKIVKGLSTFARDGSQDPFERISVQSIIEDTLQLSRAKFKKSGVRLIEPVISDELFIECRAVQISQILVNFLNNALHATESLSDKWVKLAIEDKGDWIEFSIADSGKGIPPDIREKILHPFFTTKGVGKGTGLGLSISKGIAESHQGRLWLDTDSSNTRFVIILPKNQLEQKKAA